jgi:acetyl esterase/lipase
VRLRFLPVSHSLRITLFHPDLLVFRSLLMKCTMRLCLACLCAIAVSIAPSLSFAADESYTRAEDVIYGRKFGTALTLDVFTPKENANGAAIIWVISGGWYSSHDAINAGFIAEYLKRGYTVFAVVHGSQPKFTIPEVLEDMHRSVRFIRSQAEQYKIDPNRIGITGASAGGHLSLMQGTAGTAGNPEAKDPVDRVSSRVQAVACFFPPTDFLNYGKPGEIALGNGILKNFRAPFDFKVFDDKIKAFVVITDENVRNQIGKGISPVNHVSADDPPSLIIHGDADTLVPIQQAEIIIAKFKDAQVPCELVVKPGAGHGWAGLDKDLVTLADWFDKYLGKK